MEQPSGLLHDPVDVSDAELDALLARTVDDESLRSFFRRVSEAGGYRLGASGLDRLLANVASHGVSDADEEGEWDQQNVGDRFE